MVVDRQPGVRFVADDARRFTAVRTAFVQFSFVDTYAWDRGAFALTDNPLYTREAWQTFLDRLDPSGILSVTQYYFSDLPAEFCCLFLGFRRDAGAKLRNLGTTPSCAT